MILELTALARDAQVFISVDLTEHTSFRCAINFHGHVYHWHENVTFIFITLLRLTYIFFLKTMSTGILLKIFR